MSRKLIVLFNSNFFVRLGWCGVLPYGCGFDFASLIYGLVCGCLFIFVIVFSCFFGLFMLFKLVLVVFGCLWVG